MLTEALPDFDEPDTESLRDERSEQRSARRDSDLQVAERDDEVVEQLGIAPPAARSKAKMDWYARGEAECARSGWLHLEFGCGGRLP